MSDYKDFVCACLGFYGEGAYLDEIEDNFGVSVDTEEEMMELISRANAHGCALDNLIAGRLYDKIVERAVNELGLDSELFDSFINGNLDTSFSYNGEQIYSWQDLVEISERKNIVLTEEE